MWVVCLMRERWAMRQKGKCRECIVAMTVVGGGN